MTEATVAEPKSKKASVVGLIYDPYLDGCRDIGGNPDFPPLRSRRFVKKFFDNGEVDFKGITVRSTPTLDNDAQLWEELKAEQPLIKELIRKGAIIEYTPKAEGKVYNLTGYNVQDAKDIIDRLKGLDGINQLQEWLKTETRQAVINYANDRIDAIRAGR